MSDLPMPPRRVPRLRRTDRRARLRQPVRRARAAGLRRPPRLRLRLRLRAPRASAAPAARAPRALRRRRPAPRDGRVVPGQPRGPGGFAYHHLDVPNVHLNPAGPPTRCRSRPATASSRSCSRTASSRTSSRSASRFWLGEVARVLEPGGTFHATWFTFDRREFPMLRDDQHALYIDHYDPTHATIFDREWIRAQAAAAGLTITAITPPELRGYHWYVDMQPSGAGRGRGAVATGQPLAGQPAPPRALAVQPHPGHRRAGALAVPLRARARAGRRRGRRPRRRAASPTSSPPFVASGEAERNAATARRNVVTASVEEGVYPLVVSRLARQRRKRRNRSGPGKILLLTFGILAVGLAIGGLSGVGLRRQHRDLGPVAVAISSRRTRARPRSSTPPTAPRASASSSPTCCARRSPRATSREVMRDATVAIEDRRFYEHKGVDFEGVVRAAIKNLESGDEVQGGSTLTMQLVRNLYTGRPRPRPSSARSARPSWPRSSRTSTRAATGKALDPQQVHQQRALRHGRRPDARSASRPPRASSSTSPPRSSTLARGRAARRPAAGAVALQPDHRAREAPRRAATTCCAAWPTRASSPSREAAEAIAATLGVKPGRYYTFRREGYFFDYVQQRAHRRATASSASAAAACGSTRRSTSSCSSAARARSLDEGGRRHRPRRRRSSTIDPRNGLHPGDGLVGPLRRAQVQPRRPGPPPAGLDVQDDGADGRAAPRRRPGRDELHVDAAEVQRPASTGRSTSRPTPTATSAARTCVRRR